MKKVVVLGPESTGKSTLSAALAAHYNTVWCPEAARDYLLTYGQDYTFADLLTIAQQQARLEDSLLPQARNGIYIIDTDQYVMKVWCEVVFGDCHPWILKEIAQRRYDLYLLCATDLPWVQDGLREYPDEGVRQRLFKMYLDLVQESGVPWTIVSGTEAARVQSAGNAIDALR